VDIALSRFRDDSELTALNRLAGSGAVVPVSWRLRTALAAVHRAGRITDGRFDARVLATLERIGERGAPLDAIVDEPDPGPYQDRELDRPSPAYVPDRPLDMGGIGKGLALRWAARDTAGVLPPSAGFLLEAGGDIVTGGEPPAGGWLIGIEDPVAETGTEARASAEAGTEARPVAEARAEARPIAVVGVVHGAVATSSVRVRNWVGPDGRPVHHLVDPRTGEPARSGLIAVTVAAPDPAWAEVWSKALFLAGRAGIGEEARARGLAAWWVDGTGRLGMTPEARLRSAWVAEDRLG
jgi:thiamine biosynthesis lipoprotein